MHSSSRRSETAGKKKQKKTKNKKNTIIHKTHETNKNSSQKCRTKMQNEINGKMCCSNN